MKTKLLLTSLLFFIYCLAYSQVPQGFNYQAIARLTTGEPIINTTLPVRITIQADSLGTAIIWQELHNSVTTNGFGLITLVLGKGARQATSTVATFNAIDWTVSPKFIKTEINYSGWKTMGVTRLWSVPYSTIAGSFGGPVKKLAVKGETVLPDDALFEVKNKDGQTVFAVYNEGVRIYVSDGAKALKGGFAVGGFGTDKAESTKYLFVGKDSVRVYLDTNPLTKKLKGGFAVGGYDLTKGVVQDYLDVNSDSVRIYIDSDASTKKLKGGFAVGGYDMTKGTNTNYMNVNTDASGIINPSQKRILWYPIKNAFLTGRVLIEDKDSVGENSFASGYESKAKGMYSQALGYKSIARGDYSTAIGKNALADKINSFAFGDSARAINAEGYAIGRGAVASGYRSFSFGSAGIDTLGNPTDITKARGDYSFAIGQGSESTTIGSFSIGITNIASGEYSTAIGYNTRASGNFSATLGKITTASGYNSTAIGYFTKASGSYSTANGLQTIASGNASTSMGYNTVASGAASTAMGLGTKANTLFMVAAGAFNDTTKYHGNYSYNFWYDDDPLFVIGNGKHSGSLSNAITVLKNGYAGIGTKTPATLLHIKGNGRVMNLEGSDHCYIRFYPDGYSAEGASFGFLSNVENYITLENNISSGHIILYPGSGGNIGIGTKNPSYKLDINTGSLANITGARVYWQRMTGNSSNSDQLRIFHRRFADGSDYSTAEIKIQKTVDLTDMGYISFKNNYIEIGNGSTAHMTITSGGNVGIGTTTPDQKLVVYNGTTTGRYTTTGWTHVSDIRLKENVSSISNILTDVMKLQGVRFNFVSDDTKTGQIGFVAQDFEKVFPEFVVTDNDGFKSIAYGQISVVIVEAIKEQQQQIESYKSENDNLKTQFQSLLEKVDSIESQQKQIDELKSLVNSLIANQTAQVNK